MDYIVGKNEQDVRLDKFLRKKYEKMALTEIFKAIRTGKVKVNGKKSKENYRLQEGDALKIFLESGLEREEKFIPLSNRDKEIITEGLVYERDGIVVFNKPVDLVMHKGSGHDYGLSEMLKSYYKENDFAFANRIDKNTSGLIVGGMNLPVLRELSEILRERDSEKRYYILVEGIVKQKNFTLKSYLKKVEDGVIELQKYEEGAKESISYFKVLRYGKNCTLLEGTLETGRTHQLRVQLAGLGHPILGDGRYGKGREKRMFLHSYYLKIEKLGIEISLPLPEEFERKL
jgi:23S rRNA pseudouridine955/2504/2580 synthase